MERAWPNAVCGQMARRDPAANGFGAHADTGGGVDEGLTVSATARGVGGGGVGSWLALLLVTLVNSWGSLAQVGSTRAGG